MKKDKYLAILEDSRDSQFNSYLSRLVHLINNSHRYSALADFGLLTLYTCSS